MEKSKTMNLNKLSVIVPVIYLTDYSKKAISDIFNKADKYQQICFIISCSRQVIIQLREILKVNSRPNVKIVPSSVGASNHLRYNGLKYAETEYVYYQDCDDEVDYQVVLDNLVFCDGNNVVCFNIKRKLVDEVGNVIEEKLLYPLNNFNVRSVDKLMTNIVNKLIPKKLLEKISFYNIPFSQDLSLSFQLFEMCSHYYIAKNAYLYINNPKSTAGIKKTDKMSLLRVVVVERLLMKLITNKNIRAFVKFRYENLLQRRFAYLSICYWPSLSIRAISPFSFGIRGATKHLYHYIESYYSCIRVYIKNSFITELK